MKIVARVSEFWVQNTLMNDIYGIHGRFAGFRTVYRPSIRGLLIISITNEKLCDLKSWNLCILDSIIFTGWSVGHVYSFIITKKDFRRVLINFYFSWIRGHTWIDEYSTRRWFRTDWTNIESCFSVGKSSQRNKIEEIWKRKGKNCE